MDKQSECSFNNITNLTKSRDIVHTVEKVTQLLKNQKKLEKQITTFQKQLASGQGDDLTSKAIELNGVKLLATEITDVDATDLRILVDKLKDKLGSAVVVLAIVSGKKVSLVVGVTKDLTNKYQAGKILNHITSQIGGKGGGRADMAQGGGIEPEKLTKALD